MPTEVMYFKGKVKAFRQNTLDDWGRWSHQLYPVDAAELERFRALGMKNEIKDDEDGWYTTISRPMRKEIKGKYGERKELVFNPPEVIDTNGLSIQHTKVGNGSDVTTKVEVYDYTYQGRKGKACRWVSTRIDNLVPYTEESRSEEEKKAVSGLTEQPEHPKDLF